MGQEVLQMEVGFSENVKLDVSTLKRGLYFLFIAGNNGLQEIKKINIK